MGKKLTHFDARGQARMVDVAAKDETRRLARACGRIRMSSICTTITDAGRDPGSGIRNC